MDKATNFTRYTQRENSQQVMKISGGYRRFLVNRLYDELPVVEGDISYLTPRESDLRRQPAREGSFFRELWCTFTRKL